MLGGCLKVTLVFCFGPKPTFCSFDLDLDQAEQQTNNNNVDDSFKSMDALCAAVACPAIELFNIVFDLLDIGIEKTQRQMRYQSMFFKKE